MAKQEAKVKLRIDTSKAKADLQQVTKEGEATTGRISRRMRERGGGGAAGGGLRGFGLGAGVGALSATAIGAGRRAVSGGLGDVFGEVFAGATATADAFLGGPEARAKRQARDEAKVAFKSIVGREGFSPDMIDYHQTILRERFKDEKGASDIEKFLTGGVEGSVKEAREVLDKLIDAIVGAIKEGFYEIISRALSFGGK